MQWEGADKAMAAPTEALAEGTGPLHVLSKEAQVSLANWPNKQTEALRGRGTSRRRFRWSVAGLGSGHRSPDPRSDVSTAQHPVLLGHSPDPPTQEFAATASVPGNVMQGLSARVAAVTALGTALVLDLISTPNGEPLGSDFMVHRSHSSSSASRGDDTAPCSPLARTSLEKLRVFLFPDAGGQ